MSSLTKEYLVCFYDKADKGRTKTTLESKEFFADGDQAAVAAAKAIQESGKKIVSLQRIETQKQPRR